MIWILSEKFESPRSVVYAISGATLASFTVGGIGLYMDWWRWTLPGIADVKGSYVMLDQGLTGLTKATFPPWIVVLFLSLYPFWFALGFETAKKRMLTTKALGILMIGVLLLIIPSIIESHLPGH